MKGASQRKTLVSILTSFMVLATISGVLIAFTADEVVAQGDPILRIGCWDEPKGRNILAANDVWTHQVLDPVYDDVLKFDPKTDELLPYILKGTDVNGDGIFHDSEYGVFGQVGGDILSVVAFYDFNGVLFHDGYQATVEDLLFTYHMDALDADDISLDVLKDMRNLPGSNYSTTRWLHLWEIKTFDQSVDWNITFKDYSDPNYNVSLRAAVQFRLQGPYLNFFKHTLSRRTLPAYLWQQTGCIWNETQGAFECGIHRNMDGSLMDSFGIAYDPVSGNGVPPNDPDAFDYGLAESWRIPDEYVIGTGPFRFDKWVPGQFSALDRNDEYFVEEPYLHMPYIEGMLFKLYKTSVAAAFALINSDIDYIGWSVIPAFLPELLADPYIEISDMPKKSFTSLIYNMRNLPFGYPGGDPHNGDGGLYFRQAVAHLIDKKTIVSGLLQNFGVIADGPVSPVLTRWYNSSLPQYDLDEASADVLLDAYDPWQPSDGPCLTSGLGCRTFPVIGTSPIEILTPVADYDPIASASGNLIAQAMRDVGINARSVPAAFGEIVQKLGYRDFQMAIYEWEIDTDPSEYIHSIFYSRKGAQGLNYAGYHSDEFDMVTLLSREEQDAANQADLVKWAQGLIAYDRPVDPLYFRVNLEAYGSNRFINWTVGDSDSIYSYWSWIGIFEPSQERLYVISSIQSNVKSGETAEFVATVTDRFGTPVGGSTVYVYTGPFNGEFSYGAQTSNLVSGVSDANGQLRVTYIPPMLALNDTMRMVLLHCWATHPAYNYSVNYTIGIFAYPPDESFLSLFVEPPLGNMTLEGETALIRLHVLDQDGSPVPGADVFVSSSPPASISPSVGVTDINGFLNGQEYLEFYVDNVDVDTQYSIGIEANRTGYADVTYDFSLLVRNNRPPIVSITSLSPGQVIGGLVNISGEASDPDGDEQLVRVEFSLDSGGWENATGTTYWSFELDTLPLSEDSHTTYARSFDGREYSALASVEVIVNNNEPPTIISTSLSPGQVLKGVVTISGEASDADSDDEIEIIEYRIDDGLWENATGTTDWYFELDTAELTNGNHALHLRAFDGYVYSHPLEIPFVVENPAPREPGLDGLTLLLILAILVIFIVLALSFFLYRKKKLGVAGDVESEDTKEDSSDSTTERQHND